jgi:integrase
LVSDIPKLKKHVLTLHPKVEQWITDMNLGGIYPRRYSDSTKRIYLFNSRYFLKYLKEDLSNLIESFIKAVQETDLDENSKRKHIYESFISYVKSLAHHKIIDKSILEEIKPYKPRRTKEPKRTTIKWIHIEKLLKEIDKQKYSLSRKILYKSLILVLFFTGLRARELVNLKISDINLETNEIQVFIGKGGKHRKLGINKILKPILEEYMSFRKKLEVTTDKAFLHTNYGPYTVDGIGKLVKRLHKLIDLSDCSPHSYRRGTAYYAAIERNVPLAHVQVALNHKSICTTMNYIQVDREKVLEEMKNW